MNLVPIPTGSTNGTGHPPSIPQSEAGQEAALTGKPYALGYRATLPSRRAWYRSEAPLYWQVLADVPAMHCHPQVNLCLSWYCAGIWPAKFTIKTDNPKVEEFVQDMLKRWWQRALHQVQWTSYSWGWCAGEICYKTERGQLKFDRLLTFSPYDGRVLTQDNEYIGVRIRSTRPMGYGTTNKDDDASKVDLWGPKKGLPSKALWFMHNPIYGTWYGWTQLYGAYRSWERVAVPNGAEEVLDGAMYRLGYQGPTVRFPIGRQKATRAPGESGVEISNSDIAMEMAENLKAGASIAFSSEMVPGTQQYAWDAEYPSSGFDPNGIIVHCDRLNKNIAIGIGLPYEMFQAGDSGGYNGRSVPKESYYIAQQRNAEAQVQCVREHFLDALVEWNFGPEAWYEVEVQSLLESQAVAAQGMDHMPGSPGSGGGPPQPGAEAMPGQEAQPADQNAPPEGEQKPGFDISALYQQMSLEEPDSESELLQAVLPPFMDLVTDLKDAVHRAMERPMADWCQGVKFASQTFQRRFKKLLGEARMASAVCGIRVAAHEMPGRVLGMPLNLCWEPTLFDLPFEGDLLGEWCRALDCDGFLVDALEQQQQDFAELGCQDELSKILDACVESVAAESLEEAAALMTERLESHTILCEEYAREFVECHLRDGLKDGLLAVLSRPTAHSLLPYAKVDGEVMRRDDPAFHASVHRKWKPLSVGRAAQHGFADALAQQNNRSIPNPTYVVPQWMALEEGSGERAPPGGIVIGGKFFKGGTFIPKGFMAKASPEEKKELDAKKGQAKPAPKQGSSGNVSTTKAGAPKPKKFGTLMFTLSPEDAKKVTALGGAMADFDLAEEGRETNPHITVLHGLEGISDEDVRKAMGKQGPIQVRLGKTNHFPAGDDGEPVYLEVISPELTALHDKLRAGLPNEQTHSEYIPHITVGYVKPGRGEYYDGIDLYQGDPMAFDSLTYSDQGQNHTEITL